MKKLIVLLLVFNCIILNAQSCVHDTLQYIDLKVYQPNNYLFSPLEKGKIWFAGRKDNLSQWYELDVESKMISTLATKFGAKKPINFKKGYLIDSLDNSFWFVGDSLYRYDWNVKTLHHYVTISDYNCDNWNAKKCVFFTTSKGLYVYEKENKIFKPIYENAPFPLRGLVKDAKSGNIYINESTYFDEETYEIHYCTDDKVNYFQGGRYGNFQQLKNEKKQNYSYHKGEYTNYLDNRDHFDDKEGCWYWDRHYHIDDNNYNHFYYRNHHTKEVLAMQTKTLPHLYDNNTLFYDDCYLYQIKAFEKQLIIVPKKYLLTQMKPFDQMLFLEEKKAFDSLNIVLFPNQSYKQEDIVFDEYWNKIKILKNRFDDSYNYTLKPKITSMSYDFATWYEDKSFPKKEQSFIKIADSGKLPPEFQDFCKVHIRRLAQKGEVYDAYNKYKKYHKLYPSLTVKPNNYDSLRLFQLEKLIKTLNRNDRKIKAPDSLLWAKYLAYNPFCNYWFESECGDTDKLAIDILKDFIKKYPQSALIDLVEYTYIVETQVRGCCSPPGFSQKQINIFENFIKKYPQSKYKNKVLEAEMKHFTNTTVNSYTTYKSHLIKALSIARQLKKENYFTEDSHNFIANLEENLESLAWKATISVSKALYKKNEPIFYTLKIKNTGKISKKLTAIDCDKQPKIQFILVKDGHDLNENSNNIYSFCQTIEPPRCPESELIFKPNEEKIYKGTLDYVAFYGGLKGTIKFIQTGTLGLEVNVFDHSQFSDLVELGEYSPTCKFQIE